MKRLLTFGLAAAVLFAGAVVLAQDPKAPSTSGKAAAPPSTPMMAQMDEHMKKMQALHEKMTGAATPEDRQKAAEEAHREMRDGMAMMKPMMQGGGMMGGDMPAQKGRAVDSNAQMQMMGKRMDMMQMMMQLMMDQHAVMAPPKAPVAPQK